LLREANVFEKIKFIIQNKIVLDYFYSKLKRLHGPFWTCSEMYRNRYSSIFN